MQYTVLTPLNHDLQLYAPGSTVELNEADAARLIEGGVVRDPNEPVEDENLDLSRRVAAAKKGETVSTSPSLSESKSAEEITDVEAPEAEDSKPLVSDSMKRDELEVIALAEGCTQEMIDACENKASLVELIDANRNPVPAEDVSADL